MRALFCLCLLLLLSACVTPKGGGYTEAYRQLNLTQRHHNDTGREAVVCYLPNMNSTADEIVCAAAEHVPAGAVLSPYRGLSPSSAVIPRSSGGSVRVKGYYRKDGTYVRPHSRKAPRRKR